MQKQNRRQLPMVEADAYFAYCQRENSPSISCIIIRRYRGQER